MGLSSDDGKQVRGSKDESQGQRSPSDRFRKADNPGEEDVTRFAWTDDESSDFDLHPVSKEAENRPLLGALGDYLLLDRLGSGGMGEVFRAEHRTMDRQVALKVLPRSLSDNPQFVERFYAEVRAIAKLMHPNIVTAFDAGEHAGVHFLVMELIEGGVLSRRIIEKGPMSVPEAVSVLRQAASALEYAHRLGIVHRDIKPGNLMLTRNGTLKILDFGLAQFGEREPDLNTKQQLIGTVEFMSPEQISSPNQTDARSDLYSLGATLFLLLTGRPMFSGQPIQVAQAHLRQKPPALYEVRADVDLRLDAVFQRLVAKSPDERLRSASDLLETLDRLNLQPGSSTNQIQRNILPAMVVDRPTSGGTSVTTLGRQIGAFAIDLGMLCSTAAYFDSKDGPKLVPIPGGGEVLRNMLWSSEDQVRIGAEASQLRQQSPEKIFHGLQRWIGLPQLERPFGGKIVPPEVLIASLIRYLTQATRSIQTAATHAVVTIPSSYDQMHRRAISIACQIAGIEVLQLLDRSLAAALYWLDVSSRLKPSENRTSSEQVWLVVHAGGSGIEASIVRAEGLQVHLLSTAGDGLKGTHRWQHLLAEHISGLFKQKVGRDIRQDLNAATRLQRTVELLLERLTQSTKVEVRYEAFGQSIQLQLSRAQLLEIAGEPIEAIKDAVSEAIRIAQIDPTEIDLILVNGGLAKIEELQHMIRNSLPHRPTLAWQEKEDMVRGAAIQSQHVMPTMSPPTGLARAFTSSVYEIGVLAPDSQSGKLVPRVLISRGQSLPLAVSRSLRQPTGSGLPSQLQIVESTRLGSLNWHGLGAIRPKQAFPLRPDTDPLQLRLQLNESGLLDANLFWPAGGVQVDFPPTSEASLTKDQIKRWQSWLETLLLCGNT